MTNKTNFLILEKNRDQHCYHVSIYLYILIFFYPHSRSTTIAHIYLPSTTFFNLFYRNELLPPSRSYNVCILRLRRNKQNMKKERNRASLPPSTNVYNSSSAKNLQQHPEVGPSSSDSTNIVNHFTGRQIDVGKSCCTTFFVRYIAI